MKEMELTVACRHKVCSRLFLVLVYYRRWVYFSRKGNEFDRTLTYTPLIVILINTFQLSADS